MSTLSELRRQRPSKSAEIKRRLGYPVIDTDVHTVDFYPGLSDYIDRFAGPKAVDLFRDNVLERQRTAGAGANWYDLSPQQRRDFRALRPAWWGAPAANTLDLASAALPGLLYDRLEDLGSDHAVVFPNLSLGAIFFNGEDGLRPLIAKAVNAYNAELYKPYAGRLTPVAVIPLHTPQEGVETLEHAVSLGLKVGLIPGSVRRPIKAYADQVKDLPDIARHLTWLDFFGLDSAYDYDPFWAKAVELGVPLTTHSGSQGWEARNSISNFQFNHIGHFAQASDAQAKSLFFGGVTKRFPKLRIGLLEGGAHWGAALWNDIVWHWLRRNEKALQQYNPANVDEKLLVGLFRENGASYLKDRAISDADIVDAVKRRALGGPSADHKEDGVDDFAAVGASSLEELRDRFVPNFFFGAEADDPTVAHAFNTKLNALGVRLNAFWSSDAGHWDVPDQTLVLANTWNLAERGILSEQDVRDLIFANPYKFYTEANPDFFKGTSIDAKLRSQAIAAE